jgi:hypothetical protein
MRPGIVEVVRLIAPLSDTQAILPWETGRTFRPWRYGVGHSQLLLRSEAEGSDDAINVLFEAVEFMRLRRSYPEAVFRLATTAEAVDFGQLPPVRLLLVMISSPGDTGLVACSRMTVRATRSPDDSVDAGNLLLHVTASESCLG